MTLWAYTVYTMSSILLDRDDIVISERDTILVDLFGKSPEVQVLDFFMDRPLNDYMQVEIAERTGMNPRTIKRVLASLHNNEIIRVNRKIGKAVLFKLNSKSPIVERIKELELTVSLQSIEE